MTAAPTSPQNSRFARSTHVAISHLEPPSDADAPHHITAVVALVWPYSSSTRALSLLLAEPDIRLRKGKGQVKVTFHGPSAEAVAKGQVGIGDTVKLGLEGAQWIQSGENVSTPGKKIGWDLAFDGKANLDVKRDSQVLASIQVDRPVQVSAAVSPPWSRPVDTLLNGHGSTHYIRDSYSWSSPAFVKGKRLSSGSFFDASLDPFVDDDGFIVGRGRKRSKFARHSDSWRLLERTPSPEIDTLEEQLDDINDLAETATSTTPQQTIPNAVEIKILDVVPGGPRQLESTTGPWPTESDDTHLPSLLPESQSNEVGSTTLNAVHSPQAVTHQVVQGDPLDRPPPGTPVQRPTSPSGMTVDSGTGRNADSPARSDLKTSPLEPDPLSGLPSLSPSIRHSGVNTDYLLDWSSRSKGDVVIDDQQSVITSQASIVSKPTVAPPELENQSHPMPVESEMLRAPESELPMDDAWLDTGPTLPEVSPQLDQLFPPMEWPTSYEDASQTDIMHSGQAETFTDGKVSDFEFLNTSPVEPFNDAQHKWSHFGPSLDTVATLRAPTKGDRPDPTEVLVPSPELAREVTLEISQYNDPTLRTQDEVATSDPAGGNVGGPAQDNNVNAESELATDSPQQLPIDPSLVNDLEEVAELVTNNQGYAEVTREAPEQNFDSRQWNDKLDVSAVDAESQHVYYPPPFPFQQRWHRRPGSQRSTHSSQYPSLDGASNDLSADESVDSEDMLDSFPRRGMFDHEDQDHGGEVTNDEARTPSPALSPPSELGSQPQDTEVRGEALDKPQSVVVVDSSDEDTTPGDLRSKTVKDAISGAALSPADQPQGLKPGEVDDPGRGIGMGIGEIQESATDRNEGPPVQSGSPHDETSSPAVDVVATEYNEGPPVEPASAHEETSRPAVRVAAAEEEEGSPGVTSPSRRHDLAGESSGPSPEPADLSELPDKLLDPMPRYQLFTPENTQQEQSDLAIHDQTAELGRELSLPPTPQNTQEYAGVPQQTVELPIERAPDVEEPSETKSAFITSVAESSEYRKSPRLSRKIPPPEKVAEVVVPLFTRRRTSQLSPTVQLTAPNKLTVRTGNQVRVNDGTQTTEEDIKPMETSSTQDVALKRQHTAQPSGGLTTSFSYYTPLSLLPDQFSQSVDVLALSTTASVEPQRAKSGPRDWHITLHLIDPSLQGNKTITAQIFRPYKTALPKVERGHVVLLRNFKVQSRKRKCMLLSMDSSAWTVFAVHENSGHKMSKCEAVTVGPPVEYGSEEMRYAAELKKWWVAEGEGQHPSEKHTSRASRHMPVADKGDTAELTHVLRDGTTYEDPTGAGDEVADPETYHELRDGTIYQDPPLTKKSDPDLNKGEVNQDGPAVVHELRDGTLYQDPPVAKKSTSEQEIGEADAEAGKSPILHELRDGTLYPKDTPTLTPREQKRSRSAETAKIPLPIGDTVVVGPKVPTDENDQTNQQTNQEPTSIGLDANDDLDSGEESPTNEAVSSQIYHELRNGRRYFDPTPAQMRVGELQQQDEENEDESVIHELRDGVTYIDD